MSKRYSVLVVEDDPDVRESIADVLSQEGYDVHTAENGREALDVLDTPWPRVILLDLRMPVMDGYQLLALLKADRVLKHIPVVIMSAHAPSELAGAERVIKKPMLAGTLLEVIGEMVKLDRRTDPRIAAALEVNIDLGGTHLDACKGVNISRHGVLFEMPNEPQIGTPLVIELHGKNASVVLNGEVRHVEDAGEGLYYVGASFVDVGTDQRSNIDGLLEEITGKN